MPADVQAPRDRPMPGRKISYNPAGAIAGFRPDEVRYDFAGGDRGWKGKRLLCVSTDRSSKRWARETADLVRKALAMP